MATFTIYAKTIEEETTHSFAVTGPLYPGQDVKATLPNTGYAVTTTWLRILVARDKTRLRTLVVRDKLALGHPWPVRQLALGHSWPRTNSPSEPLFLH
ncbi:hypothetical protein WN51_06548 [Melipona quadrifasciata]|uniref:Uncharacterized protein n=1 Tax=Melipona quadrifasciata TaxID=166423 RepID=A0A0N0BD21_9HYME|nr:hypothetical protein WN51_06548 [Melipona quadrifasciata]